MRKEAILFSASVIASVALCGLTGAAGLFIFGFAWLVLGSEK